MTELSRMLIAGTLIEGATVTIGVDAANSKLTYAVDLSMVPEADRAGKKLKVSSDMYAAKGPIIEELEDDMED